MTVKLRGTEIAVYNIFTCSWHISLALHRHSLSNRFKENWLIWSVHASKMKAMNTLNIIADILGSTTDVEWNIVIGAQTSMINGNQIVLEFLLYIGLLIFRNAIESLRKNMLKWFLLNEPRWTEILTLYISIYPLRGMRNRSKDPSW